MGWATCLERTMAPPRQRQAASPWHQSTWWWWWSPPGWVAVLWCFPRKSTCAVPRPLCPCACGWLPPAADPATRAVAWARLPCPRAQRRCREGALMAGGGSGEEDAGGVTKCHSMWPGGCATIGGCGGGAREQEAGSRGWSPGASQRRANVLCRCRAGWCWAVVAQRPGPPGAPVACMYAG